MNSQPELKLELSLKDHVIKTYTFKQNTVVVGRDPTADIIIDNTGISRFHMKIELVGGGAYVVKDMGSTNGIFLNDQMVKEEAIRNNDVITLGKFTLKVGILKDEPSASLKPAGAAPKDDIDGTTVLSKEQMAKMMANVKKEPAKKADAPIQRKSAAEPSGVPMGALIGVGIAVLIIAIVVVFFVM